MRRAERSLCAGSRSALRSVDTDRVGRPFGNLLPEETVMRVLEGREGRNSGGNGPRTRGGITISDSGRSGDLSYGKPFPANSLFRDWLANRPKCLRVDGAEMGLTGSGSLTSEGLLAAFGDLRSL
jgi:hypothetical protein